MKNELAMILPLAISPVSWLSDIFVDLSAPNCSSGTGAADSPVCSIDAAIALASPGDVIHIAPGNYVTGLVFPPFDLDFVGTGGASATSLSGLFSVPTQASVEVDGLTFPSVTVAGDLVLRNSTISGGNSSG